MTKGSESDRIVRTVRDLAPTLAARAAEIEAARRLPIDLVDQLRAIGLFRMLVPRSHGGFEIDFPATVEILTQLAAADGAVGWTAMIGCETPQLFALLPRSSFDTIYVAGPDVICAGAFAPQGSAAVVDGGYRVNGRWAFASGCQHADWLFANCIVIKDGKPAAGLVEGMPRTRCMVMPALKWEILDTWRTMGMRGTGSHDISVNEATVSEEWSFDLFFGNTSIAGPLFVAPLQQFLLHIGAVALGIAEAALRDLTALAGTNKRRLYAIASLADSQLFQYRLGRAEADAQAARTMLHATVASYWSQALGGEVLLEMRNQVLRTVAWVVETSARVVDTCYTAAGGSAIYESSSLQRRLRDIYTLKQHASVAEGMFAIAGAQRLGRSGPLRF